MLKNCYCLLALAIFHVEEFRNFNAMIIALLKLWFKKFDFKNLKGEWVFRPETWLRP